MALPSDASAVLFWLQPSLFFPSAEWSVETLLRRWNLRCVDVRLDSFGANKPKLAGSSLPGRHHVLMTVITLAGDQGAVDRFG